MRNILLSVLVVFPQVFLFSQKITGEVHDAENNPIEFATVRLFSAADSTVKGGAITALDGRFEISGFDNGSYYIKITFAGHEPFLKNIDATENNKEISLGVIRLSLDKTLELEGVVAIGSLDVLKAGIDKKIYNTEEDLSTRGGSVEDVLNNIPSVSIDQDGNITLRGDGNVTVLIDGRPSALVMGDGKSMLSSLPANSIERVEVVTNPSAKYDPDGTAGIINIVLKKNKIKGFSGLVSATAATGNQYEGNAAISYRNNKVNAYFNYSYNHYEGFRNFYSGLTQYKDTDSATFLYQNRPGTDNKSGHTAVIGLDYFINSRNTLALTSTAAYNEHTRTADLTNMLYSSSHDFISSQRRKSLDPELLRNVDYTLSYGHKFKENKGEWNSFISQSFEKELIEGFYYQQSLDGFLEPLVSDPLDQQLTNHTSTQLTTIQSDLSLIFEKLKARIETGAKFIGGYSRVNPYSERYNYLLGEYEEDTLATFDFSYTHTISSLYATWGQELGKFKYQIGVRGEYATQVPNLLSENNKVPNEFYNAFPSGHVRYSLTERSELSVSYSRRINRPRSGQLNPFTSYADPMNLRNGNPYLMPEYIDSYDLGYSFTAKKIVFSLSAFYRNTKDVINRVRVYYPDNTAVVTFSNIDQSQSTGGEAVFILKFFDWWKTTLSMNANYMKYQDATPGNDWNNSGINWGAKVMSGVDFWKNTASFQVNYNYNAPWITPQGRVQRMNGLDLSLEKRFFNKQLAVLFKVADVFNEVGFRMNLERESVAQISRFKWESRRFFVTVTYKFGKFDNKIKTPKSGGGGDD